MSRPNYRLEDEDRSEIARVASVAPEFSGPHPTTEELFRRDRKAGDTRRLKEFLRIERGHTV